MRTTINYFTALPILVLSALGVAACGSSSDPEAGANAGGGVSVVVSTTQATDLVRNVAGERASVTGVLATNSDPHDYEPKPSDAEALTEADLIVGSGGDLDIWLEDLVDASGSDAEEILLIDSVETIEGEPGEKHSEEEQEHSDEEEHGHSEGEGEEASVEGLDPHWWQDPRNAILAVATIAEALSEVDPEGADEYAANADAYIGQLERLDEGISTCIDSVPPKERKLVTSHDALGYFADRYEIEVVGAAVPALSTQAQASAGETAELVELIRSEGARAVFPEAGVSAGLEQAIADDAGAQIGGELWADTLGPEGSSGETYLDAMAANASSMVEGFTGGAQSCQIPV